MFELITTGAPSGIQTSTWDNYGRKSFGIILKNWNATICDFNIRASWQGVDSKLLKHVE